MGPVRCLSRRNPRANSSSAQSSTGAHHQQLDYHISNIEALGAVLRARELPSIKTGPKPTPQLFLAAWFTASLPTIRPSEGWQVPEIPEPWLILIDQFRSTASRDSPESSLDDLWMNFKARIQGDEDLFVTNSGYFGRSSRGVAKRGHQVAIIGGAFIPHLLDRQPQGHYHFVCPAYVEGIMDLEKLAPGMEVTRIELE